jgi:AcrR family transcriptional regulator
LAANDDPDERERRLRTEQAQRIVAAARRLVAERGIERSHVVDIANEAGVARGLVTYYFGTKDRLLGEVLEADAQVRLQRLHELVGAAGTLDELLTGMGATLGDFMSPEHGAHLAMQELGSLALRNDEIRARQARVRATYRVALAEILIDKERAGIITLRDRADHIAAVIIALGQGIATEAIADPDWDRTGAVRYAQAVVRGLLTP